MLGTMDVSVVALNAERPPDWLAVAVAEQRGRLHPRRHDVGLGVGQGAVVAQPPPAIMTVI